MSESTGQFRTLDDSIADRIRQARLDRRIEARTRELFGTDGSKYGNSREEAREQATLDVMAEAAQKDF